MTHEQIHRYILQATENSTLGPLQKLRIRRVMASPFRAHARAQIIGEVTNQLLASEMVVVTETGAEAAVDLDEIISFIERLLPLIIQIIRLFGG